MTRLDPPALPDLPQHAPVFEIIERSMGVVPNSLPAMARKAGLLEGVAALEPEPLAFARAHPARRGREAGKHG